MANRKFNEVPIKSTIVPADEVVLVDSEDSLKLKRVSATVFKGSDGAQGPQGPQGIPGIPGTGTVASVVAGTNISVDNTDVANPVVSVVLGADENFVTNAEKAILASTSGINTGDQDLYFSHSTIYNQSVTAISYNQRVQVINFSDALGVPPSRRLDCTLAGYWEVIAVNSSVVAVEVYDNFGSLEHIIQPGVVSFIKISGNWISPIFFRSLTTDEVTKLSNTSGTNTGDQTSSTVTYDNAISGLSATNVKTALDELAAEKIQEPPTTSPGYVLTWNGTGWVAAEVAPTVGTASKFYLDATDYVADNLALSATPSAFAETSYTATADADINGGIGFMERFVSSPLGLTEIPGGTWTTNSYVNLSSVTGTNFVETRINKRVIQVGMTGTFTGSGTTRTFTVTGGAPFVAGDVGAGNVLSATLIETPLQTAWISSFISSSKVTVTLTDAGYVNESNVPLNALYYLLFRHTSPDLNTIGSQLVTVTTTQPTFTIGETDRLVAAYFLRTDSSTARTCSLYYGGTTRFSSFTTPLAQAVPASSLKTATGEVSIGTATAPTAGQVLTAMSGTVATWQTPAGGGGGGGPSTILEYSTSGVPVAGVAKSVRLSQAVTFSKLAISLGTRPVGGNFEVNVKKNGSTILSGNLTITTTETATNGYYTVVTGDSGKATIATTTAAAEDVISLEIIAGSGNTFIGADVYAVLTGTYS